MVLLDGLGSRLLVLLFLFTILIGASASAAKYNAVVWVTPSVGLEMNQFQYNISVNNYGSTHSIKALYAKLDGLVPTDVVSVSDWDGAMDNETSQVWWENGTVSNNVFAALFQFSGITPAVTGNTTLNLTITTTYHNGHDQTHHFPIKIIDDMTGPELSNMTPVSGAIFIKNTTITAAIDARDEETGVQRVAFSYGPCDENDENSSQVMLTANGSRYSAPVNLSGYADSAQVCFTFNATSGGGAQNTRNGTFLIDNAAPVVTAVAPRVVAASSSPFSFSASDDASSLLACDVLVDGNGIAFILVSNGSNVQIDGQPDTQGMHTWYTRCIDTVGHVGASENITYFLDLTDPQISVDGIAGVLGPRSPIMITVTDNDRVTSVEYSINDDNTLDGSASMEIDTSDFSDGMNTLTVTATDRAGNTNTKSFTVIVDKSAPVIALRSPLNTIDMHAAFQFTVTDVYDSALDCKLILDGSSVASAEATNGTINTIRYNSSTLGAHAWRIDCTDDGDTTGQSTTWTVSFIDQSGPEITLTAPAYQTRGKMIRAQAIIQDFSNVSSAAAAVIDADGADHATLVEKNGSMYTFTSDTAADDPDGEWIIRVHARDMLGNENTKDTVITITKAYVFTLAISPDPANPNETVTLTGIVKKDDGSEIPEPQAKIWLLNGFAKLVNVSESGSFWYAFNAPENDGTYAVRTSVTEELTAFIHEGNVSFAVAANEPATPDTAGNRRYGSTDPVHLGIVEASPLAAGGPEINIEAPLEEQAVQQEQGTVIPDAQNELDTSDAPDGQGARGIGAATGLFSLRSAAGRKALWTVAVMLLTGSAILLIARKNDKKEKESAQ